MKFENKFRVQAPAPSVWAALMDVERIVPCMPGAEVLERKGEDAYQVQIRVKVGPMSMTYRGVVEITDRDEQALRASLRVQAREARGQGTANATVDLTLAEDGSGTEATMATEVRLSGRAASMGRGVIADVSQALVAEFAGNLAELLAEEREGSRAAAPADVAVAAAPASPEPALAAESAALDAGQIARNVISGRLRDPRTAVSALVAAACVAIGFVFGRSRR